jgi:hypothetical protein
MTTMPDIAGAIAATEELLRRALVRGDATAQFHRQLADLREQQAAQQAAVEQQAAAREIVGHLCRAPKSANPEQMAA